MPQHDPLLDQGVEQVDIFEFMLSKYRAAMAAKNNELVIAHNDRAGEPPQIDVDAEINKLSTFINHCRKYLNDHRPTELFYPDMNFGIRLSNQESFVVAPPASELRGTMQPSNAQMVTGSQYAHEVMGNPADQSMPVIGPQVDKTKSQGPKSYDQ